MTVDDQLLVENLIDLRLETIEKTQSHAGKVLDRLVQAFAGDADYKQEGMADKVDRHDKIIASWNNSLKESQGAMKATMMIGGAIITAVNFVGVWWLRLHP